MFYSGFIVCQCCIRMAVSDYLCQFSAIISITAHFDTKTTFIPVNKSISDEEDVPCSHNYTFDLTTAISLRFQ